MLELCDGGAVDSIMVKLERPLNETQIAYIALHVCDALRFLHANNVIHRDLVSDLQQNMLTIMAFLL